MHRGIRFPVGHCWVRGLALRVSPSGNVQGGMHPTVKVEFPLSGFVQDFQENAKRLFRVLPGEEHAPVNETVGNPFLIHPFRG